MRDKGVLSEQKTVATTTAATLPAEDEEGDELAGKLRTTLKGTAPPLRTDPRSPEGFPTL